MNTFCLTQQDHLTLCPILEIGLREFFDIEAGLQDTHGRCKEVFSAFESDEVIGWIDKYRLGANGERAWFSCPLTDSGIKPRSLRGEVWIICPMGLDELIAVFNG